MRRHDAIVVGAGLAGLTAATRLAEGGADVLVLARGAGSLMLSPATIDVLGYAPDPVERPLEALAALVAREPGHPYRLVGADGVREAVAWLRAGFADGPAAPYGYAGDLERNVRLPTALGVPRPSALVPETMLAGDLGAGPEVCVVGFSTLKDFHPMLAADNLARVTGIAARGLELELAPQGRADASEVALARALDDPGFRAALTDRLAGRIAATERVAFPAVLGLEDPHGTWADLQDWLDRPVFEIPTLPPSVPGMRLNAMLRDRLRRAGGRLILNAEVRGAVRSGTRLEGLRVRTGLREAEHRAAWVVLATGGISAGGLELSSSWTTRETALDLPVAGMPAPGAPRFSPHAFDEQPLARIGVAVDDGQRPVGIDGRQVLDNVLVAGATLAGAEPWREKSGEGLSLSTGHRAAGLILAAAGATMGDGAGSAPAKIGTMSQKTTASEG